MALSDLVELGGLIDLVTSWRFFLPTVVGVGGAVFIMAASNESTLGMAMAVVVGLAGLCTGLVWQWRHEAGR